MKNVTKILTAVVLCAAVFASTNRIGNLGGNAAFWPGDEANIGAFPAQVNNHGYLQLSGVNDGDASADMVFNHNGTAWGLSFSDSYDSWVNLKWGKNGMGVSFSLTNSTSFTDAWVAAGADSGNCGSGTDDCGDATDEIGTAQVGDPGQPAIDPTPAECDCSTGADQTAQDACAVSWTAQANGDATDCSDGGTYTAADPGQSYVGPSDDYMPASTYAEVTTDGWAFSYGNTFDWGELGFHYDSDGNMSADFRKACGFWVFTDMVANLDMPDCESGDDTCGMGVTGNWFTHWDASGADVMFAMGFDYDEASAAFTQTAAIGVEANMTDWAAFRAGITWDYQVAGDDDVVGSTDYTWNTGLGFNWGGFTADMSVSDEIIADPVGYMTGNQQSGDLASGAITLTYSF